MTILTDDGVPRASSRLRCWIEPVRLVQWAAAGSPLAFAFGVAIGGLLVPRTFSTSDLAAESASVSAGAIASNNFTVGLCILAIGVVTASFGSLAILVLNGVLVGQLVAVLVESGHAQALVSGLLPHAVSELAGFALLTAASVVPSAYLAQWLAGGHRRSSRGALLLAFTVLVGTGLALLIVSAFIEEHISVVYIGG